MGKSKRSSKANVEELNKIQEMVPTRDLLYDNKEFIKKYIVQIEECLNPDDVDVETEFDGKINDLAVLIRNVLGCIANDEKPPHEIVGAVQSIARNGEDIAIRYKKVDKEESDRLRKVFMEIQFDQPDGSAQLLRDIMSGVFEGDGRGCQCLVKVLKICEKLCDALEDMNNTILKTK
ncbi:hypothetical protein TetV_422 [Tetraselmis virus 1]|uniref:Uncharacterized protein n=1 Tax=Tetraselmis virus 1 TaxID=2060617 RepID=A0A2P0VNM9_9VIRU|nr:hypothetical protein QJ968_gp632 [Tetraselmis virus 1]AUF82504.1 hypothetical protein TetV_422 [Tetraselmis virus 1]